MTWQSLAFERQERSAAALRCLSLAFIHYRSVVPSRTRIDVDWGFKQAHECLLQVRVAVEKDKEGLLSVVGKWTW